MEEELLEGEENILNQQAHWADKNNVKIYEKPYCGKINKEQDKENINDWQIYSVSRYFIIMN